MQAQEAVDRMEREAVGRYLTLRSAFGPCWGAGVVVRQVRVRRRASPAEMWARWLGSADG